MSRSGESRSAHSSGATLGVLEEEGGGEGGVTLEETAVVEEGDVRMCLGRALRAAVEEWVEEEGGKVRGAAPSRVSRASMLLRDVGVGVVGTSNADGAVHFFTRERDFEPLGLLAAGGTPRCSVYLLY